MKMFAYVLFVLCMVVGCYPRAPTLAEEVASHPDSWDRHWLRGASSNHWALLERVVSVEDVQERIRLVTELKERLGSTPEQMLADCKNLKLYVVKQRIHFAGSCAWRLTGSKGDDPAALFAGWRICASWLDDIERLIELTEKIWNGGKCAKGRDAQAGDVEMQRLAYWVRREYELFFKYNINFVDTYRRLPESARPAFVEQIKRDFFHRPGMKLVDGPDCIGWKDSVVFPTEDE